MKERIGKLDFIKIETFSVKNTVEKNRKKCLQNTYIKKIKDRTHQNTVNSTIRANIPIKKWVEDLDIHFSKKPYRWLRNM